MPRVGIAVDIAIIDIVKRLTIVGMEAVAKGPAIVANELVTGALWELGLLTLLPGFFRVGIDEANVAIGVENVKDAQVAVLWLIECRG